MTFSYDDPTASEKDAVRFLLGDTDEDDPFVSDEEIAYFISKWKPVYGSTEYVAAALADTIAARYAREVSYSADGVSIGLGAVAQQFRDLAVSLRAQHKGLLVGGLPDAGGISPYEQRPHDVRPFSFGTGMHDNAEAGRQDYGSTDYPQYNPEEHPGV